MLNRVLPQAVDNLPNIENGVRTTLERDSDSSASMLHHVSSIATALYSAAQPVRSQRYTRSVPGVVKVTAAAIELVISLMRLRLAGQFNKVITEYERHTLTLTDV